MASYGLPYKGSKSRIAEWIVDTLPASDVLVDIFAGGCAVTHCAMLSGKWKRIYANDLSDSAYVFRDVLNGEYEDMALVLDRDGFNAVKGEDTLLALLYSFGNNRRDYLWSEALEPVKVAASNMILAPSVHERRMHYRKFVEAFYGYLLDGGQTAMRSAYGR